MTIDCPIKTSPSLYIPILSIHQKTVASTDFENASRELLIRLRTMHNCATLWHRSNHFSAQGADSNGHPNLKEPSKHLKGCNDLLVVTDHKPLIKILGDRTLDEISNTRIFRLKQRTLPWSFDIAHLPGKTNSAADATSRHPSPANEFAELRSLSLHSEMDDAESAMAASLRHETHDIIAIPWERIATETASDPTMRLLLDTIQEGFPDDRRAANDDIAAFWTYRDSLNVTDGLILYRDRVVVPPSLSDKVLRILHSAHQGVSSME